MTKSRRTAYVIVHNKIVILTFARLSHLNSDPKRETEMKVFLFHNRQPDDTILDPIQHQYILCGVGSAHKRTPIFDWYMDKAGSIRTNLFFGLFFSRFFSRFGVWFFLVFTGMIGSGHPCRAFLLSSPLGGACNVFPF